MLRRTAGAHAEANPLLRRSLEIYRKRLGENHTGVGSALQNLAELALITRRAEDLEWLDEQAQALHQRSQSLPEDHLHRSGCLLLQGTLRLARGDASGSEPMLREAAQRRRTVLSPTHWLTAYAESFLGICLSQQGRFDEAAPLLVAGYPRIAMQFGRNDPRSQRTLRAVIEACEATSQPAEAQRYRAMLMTGPP
jgi:Flp pilus assembly protein TadD